MNLKGINIRLRFVLNKNLEFEDKFKKLQETLKEKK
jgi:hypothetical protein